MEFTSNFEAVNLPADCYGTLLNLLNQIVDDEPVLRNFKLAVKRPADMPLCLRCECIVTRKTAGKHLKFHGFTKAQKTTAFDGLACPTVFVVVFHLRLTGVGKLD